MTVPIPTHTQAVIDKDFRLTLPYRRWMNDITQAVNAAQTATVADPAAPLAVSFTGSTWISVTGSIESGNISITLRDGITTDDLLEGAANLYADHTAGVYDFTADANYTLTADEYRNGFLEATDTTVVLTAGRDLVFPASFPVMLFKNSTAQTLTLKKSGQTGVTVAAGAKAVIASGPTDVEKA